MTRLYLVQHGEAKSKEQDPERPLTERGENDVRRVAAFAKNARLQVSEIRHSGKRRAEQTAAILGDHLAPTRGVVAVPGMAPNDDVEPTAREMETLGQPLMLVGHLPFLSRLASRLLTGRADQAIVRFQMGAIVCFERDDEGRWAVAWMITPELLA